VPINGHVSISGRQREFVAGAGELSSAEFAAFQRAVFRNCVRFSLSGSIHYQCMDWRHIREILDAADGVYDQFKQLVVWAKTNGSLGTFYRSRHELVFVFKAGKAKHVNNFGLGDTGRYRTNVVEYAGANTFRKGRAEDLEAHSTVKPTAMVADFILDCSNRGDLVVDPFIGSGTTLIAAHRTKRRGAGLELDPLYVDTALRRLTKASGVTPILAGDGRTFDDIAAARSAAQGG
jgi:DNA modification methylase